MKDDPIKDHPPIWPYSKALAEEGHPPIWGKDGSQVLFKERYPVILKTYDKWKDLNPLLEKYIRQQGDRIKHRSNIKAQMTEWNMQLEAGGEHFQKLVDWVREVSIDSSPVQFIPDCYDCWGAVYKKGDYTISHDHWPAIWSWTYYVNVTSQCSPLVFTNSDYKVQPSNGLLVLFPGWVKHKVPQECDHERVMVAGNLNAVGKKLGDKTYEKFSDLK